MGRLRGWSPVGLAVRTVLAVLFVTSVAGCVYLRSWPPMATVLSSSMAPHIRVGDVVLLKSLDGHAPRVGDVVLIHVPMEAQRSYRYPDRVIHRVISVRGGLVQTKGDNLHQPDPFAVPVGAVHQRVRAVVPSAGRVVGFLLSPFGLVWLAAGVIVLVVMPMVDLQRERVNVEHVSLTTLDGVQSNLRALEARLGANSAMLEAIATVSQRPTAPGPVAADTAVEAEPDADADEPDADADERGCCPLVEFPCRHVLTS